MNPEQSTPTVGMEAVAQNLAESAQVVPETASAPSAPDRAELPSIALPPPPTAPATVQSAASPSSNAPPSPPPASDLQIADDDDLIEKEWIDKAKAIVEKNRDDPHRQSNELTVVRADYMQKRYNKAIKLNK